MNNVQWTPQTPSYETILSEGFVVLHQVLFKYFCLYIGLSMKDVTVIYTVYMCMFIHRPVHEACHC